MGRTYESEGPGFVKGDRVWVLSGSARREPGVVIGHYVDWGLYRIVYVVDLARRGPRAVEVWRLSFRKEGEGYKEAPKPDA
jgi:hypothetical protein